MRAWFGVAMIAGLLIAGCGASPLQTPVERCNHTCDHQELNASGCGNNAVEAIAAREIQGEKDIGTLRGRLALRRGTGDCQNIYWAEFTPAKDNTVPFVVIMVISAVHEKLSRKVTTNLSERASTVGFYVGPWQNANACIARLDTNGNAAGFHPCLSALRPQW